MGDAKRHREILSDSETDGCYASGSKFTGAGGECAEEIGGARSHRPRGVEWQNIGDVKLRVEVRKRALPQ